jgi:hypothetical protein
MTTLSERFAQSKGQPIVVDGHTVHAIYRRRAHAGLTVRIHWVKWAPGLVQGVSVSIEGGTLRIDDTTSKHMVLWTDTAPDEIVLKCEGKGAQELSLWNCWRNDQGVTQAWVGNCGMLVEAVDSHVIRFRCNSGPQVSYEDLVFDVMFEDVS